MSHVSLEVGRIAHDPKEVLDRFAEHEVLSPDGRDYSPSDVRIVEAISRFRAGGYDERIVELSRPAPSHSRT